MRRSIHREYTLTEDEIHEALLLFFKARDIPLPSADNSLSIKDASGRDLTAIEVAWTISDDLT